MHRLVSFSVPCTSALVLIGLMASGQGAIAEVDVFQAFTEHIQRQIGLDKQTFLDAERCTVWFYRQQQQKPPAPVTQAISWYAGAGSSLPAACGKQYPEGLDGARKDFSLQQSALSLSLTFYEFVLVGDRDDDLYYSDHELHDMLESFGLPLDRLIARPEQLSALTAHFDALRESRSMESLMTGMTSLYERGYRLTRQDRSAIDQSTR